MSATIDGQSTDLSVILADILNITQELFPGEVSAYLLDDPEYPDCRFTVIEAEASGPVDDVVERRTEWHRRVSRLAESCSTLRLTLDYHE